MIHIDPARAVPRRLQSHKRAPKAHFGGSVKFRNSSRTGSAFDSIDDQNCPPAVKTIKNEDCSDETSEIITTDQPAPHSGPVTAEQPPDDAVSGSEEKSEALPAPTARRPSKRHSHHRHHHRPASPSCHSAWEGDSSLGGGGRSPSASNCSNLWEGESEAGAVGATGGVEGGAGSDKSRTPRAAVVRRRSTRRPAAAAAHEDFRRPRRLGEEYMLCGITVITDEDIKASAMIIFLTWLTWASINGGAAWPEVAVGGAGLLASHLPALRRRGAALLTAALAGTLRAGHGGWALFLGAAAAALFRAAQVGPGPTSGRGGARGGAGGLGGRAGLPAAGAALLTLLLRYAAGAGPATDLFDAQQYELANGSLFPSVVVSTPVAAVAALWAHHNLASAQGGVTAACLVTFCWGLLCLGLGGAASAWAPAAARAGLCGALLGSSDRGRLPAYAAAAAAGVLAALLQVAFLGVLPGCPGARAALLALGAGLLFQAPCLRGRYPPARPPGGGGGGGEGGDEGEGEGGDRLRVDLEAHATDAAWKLKCAWAGLLGRPPPLRRRPSARQRRRHQLGGSTGRAEEGEETKEEWRAGTTAGATGRKNNGCKELTDEEAAERGRAFSSAEYHTPSKKHVNGLKSFRLTAVFNASSKKSKNNNQKDREEETH